MVYLPLFPLETVLFPHQPLRLLIHEDRYHTLVRDMATMHLTEFGVVLIERGAEIGPSATRALIGVSAEVTGVADRDGELILTAQGGRRFTVDRWVNDQPYDAAEVSWLPELEWQESLEWERDLADVEVREASEVHPQDSRRRSPVDQPRHENPVIALWQLAERVPINPLDQMFLLEARSSQQLLERIREFTAELMAPLKQHRYGDVG